MIFFSENRFDQLKKLESWASIFGPCFFKWTPETMTSRLTATQIRRRITRHKIRSALSEPPNISLQFSPYLSRTLRGRPVPCRPKMPPPPVSWSRLGALPSSPRRPELRPGSLQRLLRPPDPSDDDGAPTPRSRARVLLQVTNITPALSGADPFSGHHGFYLRLSDSACSCYVSLHADHDDLILTNGLHIGQVIEVEHLLPSIPAPVLRKFRVLPGRFPCIQQEPADDSAAAAATCSGAADIKEVVSERSRRPSPTPPIPERRAPRQVGSPAAIGHRHRSRSITNLSEACAAARWREGERRGATVLGKLRKISVTSADGTSTDDDNDNDDESDVSSPYSSLSSARRNWDFTGSIKDRRPIAPRRRGNSVSPCKSGTNTAATQNDAANDPMESVRRKAENAFKVLSKRNTHSSAKTPRESSCTAATPQNASTTSGIKWCENSVMWSSLSSSLTKHGKVYWFTALSSSVLLSQQVSYSPMAGSSEAERHGTAGCA
ncbi:hypothetical protein GUJ93_ZPchr0007g5912 [Zizania palustris]|uniref:DUF936 domain-containing protein n=1 Tax=Zizania palustris TaxID=103762 RepID=A0A8J5W694_ZIZPA|nr:hypothetical protein GUJ93_ZPchr0007g5912 [Zizania palustris]